jgi:hypothetical protein
MHGVPGVLLTLMGPIALQAAARMWRAKRLSDRGMTNIVIAWAPALMFVGGLIQGSSALFILALTALVLAPGLLLHRVIFDLIREQGALPRSRG